MSATQFSLKSCQEALAVQLGFHWRAGEGSAFESLQGKGGILELLTEFLLSPPELVEDRFKQELTGQCIRLVDRRLTATCARTEGANFRRHIAAGGVREVTSGMRRWTARCTGACFAIGVIPVTSWRELQKDNSMDWPFVGSGFGQGMGLVKRSGNLFVANCSPDGQSWGQCCKPDREISSVDFEKAEEFSVVLDMDRARVYFEADGDEIPGSSIGDIGCKTGYRFVASVPPGGGTVTLIEDE
jgi:hypothetical protein